MKLHHLMMHFYHHSLCIIIDAPSPYMLLLDAQT